MKFEVLQKKQPIVLECRVQTKMLHGKLVHTAHGLDRQGHTQSGFCKDYGVRCKSKAIGEWLAAVFQKELQAVGNRAELINTFNRYVPNDVPNPILGLRYNVVTGQASIVERIGLEAIASIMDEVGVIEMQLDRHDGFEVLSVLTK
jgi:hypothetical protein